MSEFWGLDQTAWTAIYAMITLLLLAVAVATALYAKGQWNEAKDQTKDARAARIEASRPYVLVTVERSLASPQSFDLVVRNIGHRPAMKVGIKLDPPPERAKETKGHEIDAAKMLNEPVSLIAPGQEMRVFYDSHIERLKRDDLPTGHTAFLTYQDSSGRKYDESHAFDIEAMKGALYTPIKTVHSIGKSIENIDETLKHASVLKRTGKIEAEASVESRAVRQQRIQEEYAAIEERHAQLLNEVGFKHAPETSAELGPEDGNRAVDRTDPA